MKPEATKLTPAEWADRNSRINEFGSRHYSPGICVTMNMVENTIPQCGFACEWVSLRIPMKAATYSNLIAATVPI
jgi:hypothetical protein